MMRFVYPLVLWLLVLLPLLALLKGKRGPAPALLFSTVSDLAFLAEPRKVQPGRLLVPLRLLALALLIVAMARPQLGNTNTEIEASGIDILLAVDVSGSMEALDFTLQGKSVNRLEVVKSVIQQFVQQRPNDRIGLLAFGGRPYLASPLTLDHDWLLKRLAALSVGMVEDGTAIGSAIGVGVSRLQETEAKSRILILLTDGMNNAGTVPPLVAAEAAQALGIKVYTIGAGTKGEAPMPVMDAFGRKRLMRARVDIDDEALGQVAALTGARYFRATDTPSLEKVYEEINQMEKTTQTIKKFENYREIFSWFVMAALILLGIEAGIRERRIP